jgi:uncharacterized protein (DUF2267 family)
MGFQALGLIHDKLRAEMKRSGENFRSQQRQAVERVFRERGIDTDLYPPASIATLMAAVARAMAMESKIGVTAGHAELIGVMERFLDRLEPEETDAVADLPHESLASATAAK